VKKVPIKSARRGADKPAGGGFKSSSRSIEMSALNSNIRHCLCALVLLLAAGLLSGCETTSTGSPGAEAAKPDVAAAKTPEPPMTRERAASECWMATEKGHADMPLDKRADVVTK
jgi:hypothetical protein